LLHEVVREQLETFLAGGREQGVPVARFVERELRAYLACGVLARGFVRVHCDACGHDRLVAFSCKGRGFCPSCGGRRMADTAAHLVERVLPEVPVRQWVLTLPYPLRYRCAWDKQLTSEVLRAFLRALFADQRRRARKIHGVRKGLCASVTFIQRFGSALNLTPHFHSLVLDGVYAAPAYAPGPFLPLPPPETEDVARVMAGTARRVIRVLERRGVEHCEDPMARGDPLLATLMAASVRSRIATGSEAGTPWRRLGDRVEPDDGPDACLDEPPTRCVREGGMSLHADVAVPARDRRRLERLCRYVARPPLALDRLEAMPDGRLAYRLKRRWRDGTTHALMERHELLERLAPLIPPPRAHQVRYHGLLAPCASGRDQVVPGAVVQRCGASAGSTAEDPQHDHGDRGDRDGLSPGEDHPAAGSQPSATMRTPAPILSGSGDPASTSDRQKCEPPKRTEIAQLRAASTSHRRHPWAELLQRVFEVDALRCPRCGGRMRILTAITEAEVARRILACLALPTRAPPEAPPRAMADWIDGVTPEAVAPSHEGFDFDQSQPDEWDAGA
jgi:uncharacterized Zn finger protein (UPF0148 family)